MAAPAQRLPCRAALALALAFSLLPAPAAAQRNAFQAEGEIARLLEDARISYDNLELEASEEALDRAIRLGRDFGIRNRTLAEVYLQRGILAHVRDKNADGAVSDFVEALTIEPSIRLDPLVSTPSLERLFSEAQAVARRSGGPAPRDDRAGRAPAGGSRDVIHDPIREARGGDPLTVVVEVSEALNPQVYRVNLFFRSARADAVQKLEMRPEGARAFVARITGRYLAGAELSYYIVVEDRDSRALASVGTAREPILVKVRGDALGNIDTIPSGDSLTGGEWGDDDSDGATRKYVSIGLSLGTGGGFITDLAQPQNQRTAEIRPGFAVSPFHALLEVDFWAVEWFAITAYLRLQIVEFAHLEGGRLKFRVLNDGPHQLLLRVGGGFGRVRHLVDLQGVLDTTLEGPYHYTLGAGYVYKINEIFGFAVTPDFLHLIGDSPSLHIDLNVGVIASF